MLRAFRFRFGYVRAMDRRDLRIALAELEISQADLARFLGRPAARITAWVNAGEMPAEVRLFIWIARMHGLDVAKEALRQ